MIEGRANKKREVRHGIQDMSRIDGKFKVKLRHKSKMRGFSEGRWMGRVFMGMRDCGYARARGCRR